MNETEKISYLSLDTDWTLPLINNFIKVLMEATECTNVDELKNHVLIECVWRKVGTDMKIDHNSLKNFWYNRLHMQLFCAEPIYLNDVKIKIIEYLYEKGIAANKDIKWQNVVSHFNGYTSQFLYRIYSYLIKIAKAKTDATNLPDLIHYLYTNYIPYIVKNEEDKILPRLIYENGNIKHIDIDVEEWISLKNGENELSDDEE